MKLTVKLITASCPKLSAAAIPLQAAPGSPWSDKLKIEEVYAGGLLRLAKSETALGMPGGHKTTLTSCSTDRNTYMERNRRPSQLKAARES